MVVEWVLLPDSSWVAILQEQIANFAKKIDSFNALVAPMHRVQRLG